MAVRRIKIIGCKKPAISACISHASPTGGHPECRGMGPARSATTGRVEGGPADAWRPTEPRLVCSPEQAARAAPSVRRPGRGARNRRRSTRSGAERSRLQCPGRRAKKKGPHCCRPFEKQWWPGRESNPRHGDFQSPALPTELPGHALRRWAVRAAHDTGEDGFRQATRLIESVGRSRPGLRRRPGWCNRTS